MCVLTSALFIAAGVPLASAAPGDNSDADLVDDINDLDDDNDGIADIDECDGSAAAAEFVDDVMTNSFGIELRPSDFGLPLSARDVTVSDDISHRFGYPADSGAVTVTVTHANRHPSADVFISGINPVSDGTPTRFTFGGTLGVYLDMRHDIQWFNNDVKTLQTHDGTELTDWIQLGNPGYSQPGFSKSTTPAADGTIYRDHGPLVVPTWPTIHYASYSSELTGTVPNVRFVAPTTDFSFASSLVHPGLYPVINVFMYAECDTDGDGIADRLDVDSDNDSCPDVLEGTGSPVAADVAADRLAGPVDSAGRPVVLQQDGASTRTAGRSVILSGPSAADVVAGSSAVFEVSASSSATTDFAAGAPVHSGGTPEATSYQWSISTDNATTFTAIAGATASSLTIGPVTSVQSGNWYRVRVSSASNPCGIDSAPAQLTVFHPPTATDDVVTTPIRPGDAGEVVLFTNDSDPDGAPTTATTHTVDLDPSTPAIEHTVVNSYGTWTYDPATGRLRFESAPNAPAGTASLPYRLCDSTSLCSTATASFVVATATTAPTTTASPSTTTPTPDADTPDLQAPPTPAVPPATASPSGQAGVGRQAPPSRREVMGTADKLAFTGAQPLTLVAVSGLLLAVGATLVRGRRRLSPTG